ncbi:MAG: hypothetical protein IJ008_01870 [Clostridia bacterium]|nr:hypothetical protein [Clostridia bacterium]
MNYGRDRKFYKNGYKDIVLFNNAYDDSTPTSRRYGLKIIKNNKIYINRKNGLTLSGAKTQFERWISKNS